MSASKLLAKNTRFFWNTITVLIVLTSLAVSYAVRLRQAKENVIQYFSVWEEDLGRSLTIDNDPSLLKKMTAQLQDLEKSVLQSYARTHTSSLGISTECPLDTQVPLSLSSLPVGEVTVCFSPQKILYLALISPIFLFTLFLGALLISLAMRREWKKEKELQIAKEISELSKQVAHDIRGPLMALNALSKHSDELASDKKELLTTATSRINTIANDLLKKARLSSFLDEIPIIEIHSKKENLCDLATALREILPELQARSGETSVQLKLFESEQLITKMTKSDLQRIISNLVQNSLDAANPAESPYVFIQIHKKDESAIIEVIDNGRGISKEDIPRVLNGFSLKENGNGLGLSGAKRLVESFGGSLDIKSKLNMGTQVSLRVPLATQTPQQSLLNHEA